MPSQVSDASFCEALRARARSTWDAAVDHRFFREVASDALAEDVFARYLRIEYGFIDTAAAALGYAIAKAPSFRERRRLALNLYGLVTDQERFFAEAFEQINAPHDQRTGLPPRGEFGRAPRAVQERGDSGRIRGDFGLFSGRGVALSDVVFASRSHAVGAPRDPRLGGAPCRRSLRRGSGLVAERTRHPGSEADSGAASASRGSL